MKKDFNPRTFMELAVEEMKKSIAEQRDNKASPKVGAVLVSEEGEVLGRAHRGELREGDHAEYTLLDRKFRDKNVSGCFLFATLEPCAPGSRKFPKLGCAERVVNARIKKIWVGIEDPDPTVDRKGIKYLEDSGVEVEMFDRDLQKIINTENEEFLSQAKLRASRAVQDKSVQLSDFERAVENTTIKEFSNDALLHYISRSKLGNMQPESLEFLAILEQQQLIHSSNQKVDPLFDETRRNDVLPIFNYEGGNAVTHDNFKITSDRVTILSYREFEDNPSFINISNGLFEKDTIWVLGFRKKTNGTIDSPLAYHIELFFEDRDKRLYRQEFSRTLRNRPYLGDPILVETSQGNYSPTGLGLLLFGKNPRLRYPQAVLKVEIRYGRKEPEIQDFADPLVLIPDKVEEWLKKVLPSKINRENFARTTEYDFPIEVLREAVINAIVHRDYDIEGAKSYLIIDDEKIIVKSPGLPVTPIKFEDFRNFKAPSLSRNPKLMAVFNAMNYVEERGIGMIEMNSMPEKYNLPRPEVSWQDPYLSITFARIGASFEAIVGIEGGIQLNTEEQQGLIYIRDHEQVSRAEYSKHFNFNEKKAQRHLAKFAKLNLVTLIGKGPASKYQFNQPL